jgi:hypothetical protein
MRRTGAVICLILIMTGVADAHTRPELNEWRSDWTDRALETGLTISLVDEYLEVRQAHPWYWQARPHRISAPGDVEQWRSLVSAYFPADQVDRALCLVWYESRGDPDAYNPTSGASGLFQHLPRYWADRSTRAGWTGASIFDPEANVAVAAWLWSTGGWQHWSPYQRGLCR